jgi:hypothetical protein
MTRYEVREGYKDVGRSAGRFQEGEATVYRMRLGLTTAPIATGGPDVVLQFTPQASGWLGQTSTIVDYDLGLHEGYLRLQGDGYRFDVGRFIMDYGDALVIGNLGWHQTGRAFEGARTRLSLDKGWVDVFFNQLREGQPLSDPFAAGDQYFYGVYAGLGEAVAEGMALDAYALGQTFPTTTGALGEDGTRAPTVLHGTELTVGARAKQKVDAFDYRVEAGVQIGSRPAVGEATGVLAYQADGEVGINGPSGFRFGVGGLVASGDDPTTDDNEGYNQLYPTAHKFLGLSDVFGARSNVGSLNGSLSYKLLPKLLAKAQGHAVWALETPDGIEGFTGTEVDAHLIYPMGEGLTLRTMYGVVFGNDAGPLGSDGPVHYWEVELSFNLK